MNEHLTAVSMQFAPFELRTAWAQNAIQTVLEDWRDEEPGAFEVLMRDEETYGIAVEYEIRPESSDVELVAEPQTNEEYIIDPRVDDHVIKESEADIDRYLAERLAQEWVDEIQRVVTEYQKQMSLSPKEFATLLIMRSDRGSETTAAAILNVERGTIRGKIGRVREKFDTAAATVELDEKTDPDTRTEQTSAAAQLSDLVDADPEDFPIDEPVERHEI